MTISDKMSQFAILSLASAYLNFSAMDALAQRCTPLPLVGGTGSEVSKTVSKPTVPGPFGVQIARNNWNTDWAVPGNKKYKSFILTISSAEDTTLDLKMYLKYSDQTADEFYDQKAVQIVKGEPLKFEAKSRSNNTPYQVNLFVGGISHMGKIYTASVVGCY
jgi:hypothetical protein